MSLKYGSSVLFEFQTISDLDIGIIKTCRNHFFNTKYFKNYLLRDSVKDLFYIATLSNTNIDNPLGVIINPEYLSSIDSLLEDIYDKYEDEVLSNSMPLAPLKLLKNFISVENNVIKCKVLCKTLKQEQFIKSILPDVQTIVEPDVSKVDLNEFDSIFVKRYIDILKYREVKCKNVIILKYNYNLEPAMTKLVPRLDVSLFVTDVNNVYLVDPYVDIEMPLEIKNIKKQEGVE